MMEDRTLDDERLDTVASRLGITDRHLRRAFGAEFGVSPVEFAQTQRLLLAKRLLTDTVLPATDVAFASGFGSLRRFNALFKQRYLRYDCIARIGMPGARARTVLALARAVADGSLVLMPNADIEPTLERLRALPGIGEWTAQYIAMRALAWPDAFPHTDLGVMKALGETSARRVLTAGENWRPWRAYAVMHLWQSLHKKE